MTHHLRDNGDLRLGYGDTSDLKRGAVESGPRTVYRHRTDDFSGGVWTLSNALGGQALDRTDLEAIRDWCERELAADAPVVEERRESRVLLVERLEERATQYGRSSSERADLREAAHIVRGLQSGSEVTTEEADNG